MHASGSAVTNRTKKAIDEDIDDSTQWAEVCALENLVPLYGACALVNEVQVAVFLMSDGQQLYAIDNYDPISKANVLSRGIVGDVGGELVVASPLYKQHFSLKTGQCIENASVHVNTYAVRAIDGKVQIQVPREK